MLTASGSIYFPFTTTDTTDANATPTGTPTYVLVRNGTDTATTGNCSGSGSQWYATATVPADAAVGEKFWLRVSAVISGTTYVQSGPADYVDVTTNSRLASASYTAAPTAAAIRTEMDSNSTQLSTILLSVQALTNLSSLANLFGPPVMEIPASSSTSFPFTLMVKDQEGKAVDLDDNPTITATNAAGTSRSAGLSSVTKVATGQYTFTYSVASTDTSEALTIKASGAISAESRVAFCITSVVDYDASAALVTLQSLTTAIKAKTDNLPSTPAATGDAMTLTAAYDAAKTAAPTAAAVASQVRTELATELARVDAAVSTRLASSSYTAAPTAIAIRQEIDSNSTQLQTIIDDIAGISAGGGTVQINPVVIDRGSVDADATMYAYVGEEVSRGYLFYEVDAAGVRTAYDFTPFSDLRLVFESSDSETDVAVIETADIDITDNMLTFTHGGEITSAERQLNWTLWNWTDATHRAVVFSGVMDVVTVATPDE